MVDKKLLRRQKVYFELSSRIAEIDNVRLRALFDKSEASTGWGQSQVIEVGRSKVFVKRVPLTDVEYESMFSTRNLYKLPLYYNYGVGSAGLGAFRELVTQIKATNWVLAGEIATFPVMYHYRVVPFEGVREEVDLERHARYVAWWGGNENVGRYMLDRARANYELVLFLEYIPHTVQDWLLDNPAKISLVMRDMLPTIEFLRKKGIIHFDSHFYNLLSDGKRVYLTDFGLALDRHFELTDEERQFFRENSYYDYGLLLWSLGTVLPGLFRRLPEADKKDISEKYGIGEGAEFEEVMSILLGNFDEIVSSGLVKMDRGYVASVRKYRGIIMLMHDFYSRMRKNNAKDTRFDNVGLRRLLRETGLVPGPGSTLVYG